MFRGLGGHPGWGIACVSYSSAELTGSLLRDPCSEVREANQDRELCSGLLGLGLSL